MNNPISHVETTTLIAVVIGLLGLALLPFFVGRYYTLISTQILTYAVFAIAFNFAFGYSDIASFGHAAFFGLGAYGLGISLRYTPNSILLPLLITLAVVILYGIVIGWISTRGRGIYFALLTFSFAQMLYEIAIRTPNFTGATNGLFISLPTVLGFTLSDYLFVYYLSAVGFLAVLVFGHRLLRSPLGAAMEAVKHNQDRTEAIGYPVRRIKIFVFTLSGVLSSMAGFLYAMSNQFATPGILNYHLSVEVIIMTVIGGMSSLLGPAVGAAVLILLRELLSDWANVGTIVLGSVFIIVIMFARGGLVGMIKRQIGRW